MGNLLIINARIVTPQGQEAKCGEAMRELLDLPCGHSEIGRAACRERVLGLV